MTINVNCQTIDTVNWQSAEECEYLHDGNTVDVWLNRIVADARQLNYYTTLLNESEIELAGKYLNDTDRGRFVFSHAMLRVLLGKYINENPTRIEFTRDENNKPFLVNGCALNFNMSHSGDFILIAISRSQIGADIEKMDAGINYTNIMADQFSEEERAYVSKQPNPTACFYMIWTRKEALLKAIGKGVYFDLPKVPTLNGWHKFVMGFRDVERTFSINSLKIADDYWAAIATECEKINFWMMPAGD